MWLDYLILFGSALIAATILPFYSEVFLFALLQEHSGAVPAVLVATAGNVLGACINWWLGLGIVRFRHQRWFYFKETQIEKAQRWFQRYGIWSLLLSWVPIVGDPLTLIAGILRVRLSVFVLLVTIGKLSRYLVIAWFAT